MTIDCARVRSNRRQLIQFNFHLISIGIRFANPIKLLDSVSHLPVPPHRAHPILS